MARLAGVHELDWSPEERPRSGPGAERKTLAELTRRLNAAAGQRDHSLRMEPKREGLIS
jgi:hypothetical protein